jgi:putative flavoprotein involved in K+ transport
MARQSGLFTDCRASDPDDGFRQPERTELNLRDESVTAIVWATGFRRDFSWVHLPIMDEFEYPVQSRGVSEVPGLYFVGLHWLHKLKSGLFLGVGEDAEYVVDRIDQRTD